MKTKLVRIYPREPRRGHHVERYRLVGSDYPTFYESKGWYEVDEETANALAEIRNNYKDPNSPKVFQVLEKEQAKAVEKAEQIQAAKATAPVPVPRKKLKKQQKARKQPKD